MSVQDYGAQTAGGYRQEGGDGGATAIKVVIRLFKDKVVQAAGPPSERFSTLSSVRRKTCLPASEQQGFTHSITKFRNLTMQDGRAGSTTVPLEQLGYSNLSLVFVCDAVDEKSFRESPFRARQRDEATVRLFPCRSGVLKLYEVVNSCIWQGMEVSKLLNDKDVVGHVSVRTEV